MRGFLLLVILLVAVSFFAACSGREVTFEDVARVQEQYEAELMGLAGVVGLATGLCPDPSGEPCLKVLVEEITPELEESIPDQIEGVRVEIEVTGPIETQNS